MAAPAPPMTVALHQASGRPISYFKLEARRGRPVSAGTLELRNRLGRPITVVLDPIDAVTASTLGSAYRVRGLSLHGPARWTRLARRRVELAARGKATVAIRIVPSAGAAPGDYLSGIGVQALGRPPRTGSRGNVAISSIVRYAVGLELWLPGPRQPQIQLTGAGIKREPAGIAFSIRARNSGNVILQGVHGRALITQGKRVVARRTMGPGTFVTSTSIAYPIPTPRERPRQGTRYRVRAVLRYRGGVARLDTLVRFGRAAARRQETFVGPEPDKSAFPWLLVAIVVALMATVALVTGLRWRRRRQGQCSPMRTLDRALKSARGSGEPLSMILVGAGSNGAGSHSVASLVRARLRPTDRLCRLAGRGFLVLAPETDIETAEVLAADLGRRLRARGGSEVAEVEVRAADGDLGAGENLARLTQPGDGPRVPAPTG
jgi:hypothetical protein